VVDTGLGTTRKAAGVPTWNNRKDPFLETMTAAGFPPDNIDTVCARICMSIMSAGTPNGFRQMCDLCQARYVFGKTEYEYWRDHSVEPDHVAVFNDSVKPIADAGKAELVASDQRLTDEIALIPTPATAPDT